uniref:LGFP repeat-containing protein n=1 Tax=Mycobacterium sp. Marseille-P9652 TaxID=2654950 RepID=UPI0012E73847|nr:hypothetical protein [Mycobacterium sp. Marseille-P9652]
MRRLIGTALVSLAVTAAAAALLGPAAVASPIGDAEAAMMAAWEKAGGDTSPLGARKGDVYPVADGFALDFDGGRMFYTTDTGAKFVFGPILDKYSSLGGPAGSDLGWPTINEVPGLAGPDSRVATFSASDKPVIFWTSEHGAFVVRGAMNAAWDKLGSSGGVMGAPVGDETYDGEVTSQKFTGGQVSWNRQTKQFATEPPALAEQLKGLQVPIDPTAAINMAWRAAGGANGPLGAKQGGQYPIGGDGIAQNFAGGKVFFSPATGANAVEKNILAKYESLGGPVGSDLGFPVANESDGGVGPSSRMCTFSAADKPVIFWTSDHGAFVVRGAMKAAWDKLRGAAGKLGAPVGDQSVDGDVVSQQFTGGKVSWNRAKNTFSTDPSNLAPLLSGLQVPGQNQPSSAAGPSHAKKFTWQWWWLLAAIPVLVLLAVSALLALGWRRRRAGRLAASWDRQPDADAGYESGYEAAGDRRWGHDDADGGHYPVDDYAAPEQEPARVSWRRGPDDDDGAAPAAAEDEYGRVPGGFAADEDEDPDSIDTDSIPVVSGAALTGAAHPEAGYDEHGYDEAGYDEHGHDEAGYEEPGYDEPGYGEPGYAEHGYPEAETAAQHPFAGHPDEAGEQGPEEHPDVAIPRAAADLGTPEATAPDEEVAEAGVADTTGDEPRTDEPRTGRHAAVDADDDGEWAAALAPSGRPTIHLPLDDPYQVPDGYPIKANASFGLYYTPGSALYHDTLAEIWLTSEEVARANGFIKAD